MGKIKVFLILSLLILVFVVGCGSGSNNSIDELKIGVSAPLTGDLAATGASTKNAVLLAEEEINSSGGIKVNGKMMKVKFIIEDDENKPETTATVFQKLISQDRVLAIIGSQASKCSNAGAPIAESNKIPQITPWSTNPNVTKDRKYVFRACFIDPFQGKAVALFAYNKLGAKKAAVLYDIASDYNKGIAEVFRDEFSNLGGQIVAFETYNTKDTDFSAQLTKIKATNPDVLFLPNYYNEVPLQIQQARKLGIDAQIIGADAWDNPELLKLGGELLEGTYFSNHYAVDIAGDKSKAFIEKYKNKYGEVPDAAAALTYDAAYILFGAIERAQKADPQAIRDAIASTKDFEGVTGTISYNEGSGDPVKGAVIIKIHDGKFIYDSSVKP
ncbi:MAG: branched-chain amino acid transport system substrate-binding protein [Tepidanaerobacteraceae bacterium]|nr:branched-chain amino acid transport system substrate-binding protein [Tepidanaerobacteraceae bacterium]